MDDQATPAQIAAWIAADDGEPDSSSGPSDPDDDFDDGNRPPADERDELAAMRADGGGPGPGEAMAAGFTHGVRGSQPGYGFEGGGVLDLLAPGPVLAGFAAEAAARSPDRGPGGRDGDGRPAGLDDDELVGVICAWRRLASWAAAGETEAVAELGRRRAVQSRELKNRHLIEHLPDELAAALTLTGRSACRLTTLAAELDRLHRVRAALAAGIIDWPRAIVFADELAVLGDEAARMVAALILPRAGELTTSRLRAELRRAILALDPQAAARRRERGRKDARVEVWEEPSGNAALAGRDLPSAEVLAADQRITAQARWLQRRGAEGTLAQLRAAVFTALLSGQPVASLLPGDGGSPAGAETAADGGADRAGDGGAYGPAGSGLPVGLAGTVNLTMPLATWLGWSQRPGEVAGHGPADADTCRELAAMLAASGRARWCLTLTGPGGRAMAHGCSRAGPPGQGPPRAGPPRAGPPGTEPPGAGPPRAGPPRAGPPGTGPPGGGAGAWLAGIAISPLEAGTCAHRREIPGYRPPSSLRHAVHTRQRTCSFPGCRRPAARCDDDHTIPWDQGGRTCECNLSALCRKHHRAKQAAGWALRQPEPGRLIWRLPHGRSYAIAPDPYPV